MSDSNWPLMVFTLTLQFSVGVVLFYDLFILFPIFRKKERLPLRYQMVLLVSLLAAGTGVLFSLLHLGNPVNAMKTLSNLNSSWLSREILLVLVYSGLLLVITGLQFVFPSAVRSYKWLVDITSVAGLVLIYVMSSIYMLPALPACNSIFTPVGFYLAMMLSGSSVLLLFQLDSGSWASQKGLAVLIIAIPVIQIALLPFHMSWLGEAGDSTRQSLSLLLNRYLPAFYLRLGFEILTVAFGFWAFFSIRSDTMKRRNLFIPSLLALITSIAALAIDRFLFYHQMIPIGNL
jgi:anaerobic dimethyl sulfoxide reductase subunit C (anchor subunit)